MSGSRFWFYSCTGKSISDPRIRFIFHTGSVGNNSGGFPNFTLDQLRRFACFP